MRKIILSLFISSMLTNVSCKADEPFSIETKMANGFSRGVQSTLEDVPAGIYHEDLGKNLLERVKSLAFFLEKVIKQGINSFSGLEVVDEEISKLPKNSQDILKYATVGNNPQFGSEINDIQIILQTIQNPEIQNSEILELSDQISRFLSTTSKTVNESLRVLKEFDKKEELMNLISVYNYLQSLESDLSSFVKIDFNNLYSSSSDYTDIVTNNDLDHLFLTNNDRTIQPLLTN